MNKIQNFLLKTNKRIEDFVLWLIGLPAQLLTGRDDFMPLSLTIIWVILSSCVWIPLIGISALLSILSTKLC